MLLLETLEGVTTSLVVVTITTYSAVLATPDLVATMQATWAALHFAVGRAIGSAAGGFLMEILGPTLTYRLFAIFALVSAILYYGIYLKFFRTAESERNAIKRKTEQSAFAVSRPSFSAVCKLTVFAVADDCSSNYSDR